MSKKYKDKGRASAITVDRGANGAATHGATNGVKRNENGVAEDIAAHAVEPWSAADARYVYVAAALILFGAALRLVMLHAPPFMHDEAIHAMFAYNFDTYEYDPVYHGPLLYYLVAAVFAVLGDYDFTARLVPALMGIGLMALIIGPARRWLGDRAALWCVALVVISPCMVTYHRRLLHDALVLVLTLGSVLCFHAARVYAGRTRQGQLARLGLITLLTLFLCTKANAFFVMLMLFSFGVAMLVKRRWPVKFNVVKSQRWAAAVPLIMFLAVSFASITAVRESANVSKNEGMLYVVCFVCSFVVWVWLLGGPRENLGQTPIDDKVRSADEPFWMRYDWKTPVLGFGLVMLILSFFYGDLYLWWREPAQIPKRLSDTMGAIPGMIEYWGGQQRAPRLASRHDYYIVLMLLYELPIVVAAVGGIWRASRERSAFTDLLIWWAFTSFTAYAMANEKVPWLLPHIMLPLILLAGWWLARLTFDRPARRIAFAVGCLIGALILVRGVSATNFERGLDNHEPMFFAHTTEAFRDSMFHALEQKRESKDWIWVDGTYQWPMAWYFRDSERRYGAKVWWGVNPPDPEKEGAMRMAMASVPKYTGPLFDGWTKWSWDRRAGRIVENHEPPPDLAVWPRASWGALRLDRYPFYWLTRQASEDNGVLYEDSHQEMVIATAK